MVTVDLSEVPALQKHSLVDLQALAAVAAQKNYGVGAVLCHEGEVGDRCYLLLCGSVDVFKTVDGQGKQVATLGPGDFVGQLALVDGAPRSASVVVRQAVTALVLTADLFDAMLAAATPVALRMQKRVAIALVAQLRDTTSYYVELKRQVEKSRDELTRVRVAQRESGGLLPAASVATGAAAESGLIGHPELSDSELDRVEFVQFPGENPLRK